MDVCPSFSLSCEDRCISHISSPTTWLIWFRTPIKLEAITAKKWTWIKKTKPGHRHLLFCSTVQTQHRASIFNIACWCISMEVDNRLWRLGCKTVWSQKREEWMRPMSYGLWNQRWTKTSHYIILLLTCSEKLLVEECFRNWLSNGIKLRSQAEVFASPSILIYIKE
jgi:hypothetical protein